MKDKCSIYLEWMEHLVDLEMVLLVELEQYAVQYFAFLYSLTGSFLKRLGFAHISLHAHQILPIQSVFRKNKRKEANFIEII